MLTASPAAVSGSGASVEKRTGRPAHPLWAHFHRGEKRNRYHYHAFCVYCVAQHGAAHVAPTRGVSVDMLKHIENCPNCPLRVLESVRAIVGRRDAVRFDRLLRKKPTGTADGTQQTDDGIESDGHQLRTGDGDRKQEQQDGLRESDRRVHVSRSRVESHSRGVRRDAGASRADDPDAQLLGKHTLLTSSGSHSLLGSSRDEPGDRDRDDDALAPAPKRLRPLSSSSSPQSPLSAAAGTTSDAQLAWKMQLLKTAVAAGLSLEAFDDPALQYLLRRLGPLSSSSSQVLAGMRDRHFLAQAATRLERVQLERVKEGMHNSTIKGGLTLSLNCWTTLDLQQLVAFALVNSNGDAACVRVVDMGTQARTYSAAHLALELEDVLDALEAQQIRVMGLVADSTVALTAARYACRAEKRRALLVVPCFARQLSVLAGSLLTHAHFRAAVGHAIDVASYFTNASLQRALGRASGDSDDARIPLPNRANWHSFVDCVGALLKYCDVITALCRSTGDDRVVVPHRLKALVFADDGKLWKTLQELHTLLLPLKESHELVYGGRARALEKTTAPTTTGPTESGDFSVAPAHGLTLAHIMYQLARMNQQYAGLVGTLHEPLAEMMRARIRVAWQRYDFPVLLLAYVFNFHLDTALLNVAHDALQWDAIATYFQAFFAAWFQSPASAADTPTGEQTASPTTAVLSPISADKVRDIFSAYKTKQFPFDADTTSDYVDVSSFYSFVSDSHPEMCALCCRMYAVSLLSANVQRLVRGVGFVPTSTQSTKDPTTVELLLHVGFASSLKRVTQRAVSSDDCDPSDNSSGGENDSGGGSRDSLAHLSAVTAGYHPDEVFWNDDVWADFAEDWQAFIELELATDEFDAVTEHMVASARESASSSLPVVEMMSRKVPLDDVFVGTLRPLLVADTPGSTKAALPRLPVASEPDESEQDESVLL